MYELEGDSCTCEVAKWIRTIVTFWIDDTDDFFGNNIWNCMMVGHDDIDTKRLGIANRSHISRSTVDGDDEFYIFFSEFIKKILLEPISIMDSMWKAV